MNIDILVNGERLDIIDRSSLNLRINNLLFVPTELNNQQAEYSFSFNIPITPKNNKIFNYSNELAKYNKFGKIFSCEVYSDEHLIFKGQLKINSIKKGFYNVNLVNIKINTLDSIFEDMTMNLIDWSIPFDGRFLLTFDDVFFPLVSYGVFQKNPYSTLYDFNDYTSKWVIDSYTRFYYESLPPSPNLLSLISRYFKLKGFELKGDIFQDKIIPKLYMSNNLASDLIPVYNLGNPIIGTCDVTNTFSSNGLDYLPYNLSYPYEPTNLSATEFNWDSVNIYDLWLNGESKGRNSLFRDNCIVVPADGLYKIELTAEIDLPSQTRNGDIVWANKLINSDGTYSWTNREGSQSIDNSLKTDMPVEILLVRNTDECELIHGPNQWMRTTAGLQTWITNYPHEDLYAALNPTTTNSRYESFNSDWINASWYYNWMNHNVITKEASETKSLIGLIPTTLHLYDSSVSENFLCGFSTLGDGSISVIRNGLSWNRLGDKMSSYYTAGNYLKVYFDPSTNQYSYEKSDYGVRNLNHSPSNYKSLTSNHFKGKVSCIIYLKKNDVITLKAIARDWKNNNPYNFNVLTELKFEAFNPEDITPDWNDESKFDKELKIGLFLNNSVKVTDFINNFIKEFNLSFTNEGNVCYLNKLKLVDTKYAIPLDSEEYEITPIEYKNLLIKYKINTEEWGFEQSVPKDDLNKSNWEDYGDYQSDLINYNSDETTTQLLTTSYNWYGTFKFTYHGSIGELRIPVISKAIYMEDGYDYEESMKHDGKSYPLRYWFRGEYSGLDLDIDGYSVPIYLTYNNEFKLSYKNEDNTILTTYFNLTNKFTNYVTINEYLNADLYKLIKNGARVFWDSDYYRVSELTGFDPSGLNTTELKLIK